MNNSGFYSLLFHGLYAQQDEDKQKHPYMFISVDELQTCIEILLDRGLSFLDPAESLCDKGDRRKILLTFDDGYYNNRHALKVLEKYGIKAIFFLVKHQVVDQRLFWWDVYYKNRIKEASFALIYEEIQQLKKLKMPQIEERLKQQFGSRCFEADDDIIRPMTIAELKQFSRHPLVEVGVHSASHEILTNCSPEVIQDEVASCKTFLEQTINRDILAVSYPNGSVNDRIISIAEELEFRLGFTTQKGLNRYRDLNGKRGRLLLKRNGFPIPKNDKTVIDQMNDFAKQACL